MKTKILPIIVICLSLELVSQSKGSTEDKKCTDCCNQGNCKNGNGTSTYANGDKYVGQWKDSKPNGQGTVTFANGDKYVGQYKDGKYNGEGTFTKANGDK